MKNKFNIKKYTTSKIIYNKKWKINSIIMYDFSNIINGIVKARIINNKRIGIFLKIKKQETLS